MSRTETHMSSTHGPPGTAGTGICTGARVPAGPGNTAGGCARRGPAGGTTGCAEPALAGTLSERAIKWIARAL
eukprot:1586188-Rhodomonas_salina.1